MHFHAEEKGKEMTKKLGGDDEKQSKKQPWKDIKSGPCYAG